MPRSLLLDHNARLHLRSLTRASVALPSQGLSRARDTLNVHIQPFRWSPTFYQLAKDEEFQILDRMLVDRLPPSAATASTPPEPTGEDSWYLVRVPRIQQTGWLLGNMAYADIPLEVAELAMGQSIVAYFEIGAVRDPSLGETKTTWLWAQSTERGQSHDFDRLSVLRWNSRSDRYVTIRRSTNLRGYLPIEVIPDFKTERGTGTGFRILIKRDSELRRRTYVFTRQRVYRVGEEAVSVEQGLAPPGGFEGRYKFTPVKASPT